MTASSKSLLAVFAISMLMSPLFAQTRTTRNSRRPLVDAQATPVGTAPPAYEFFSILDGMPMLLALHHDTEVGTNRPIDVYMLVIEMQVMNSDGNFEPVGLQIHNYYTARPVDPHDDINPHNARDCKYWNTLVTQAMVTRPPTSKTWPYIEFTVAEGARVIQTNEDGAVWWSDDIQCWGSDDRFPPF